jgi:hypothetical protein
MGKDYLFRPITKIEEFELETDVFNFSVEDDESYVGQFIFHNCKCAFAYSDVFTVTSWQDGTKKIYTAYIDESEQGIISLLGTESSTEPDGIEISIPVKEGDYNKFKYTAQEFFKFFDPMPKGITLEKESYDFQMTLTNGVKFCLPKNSRSYSSMNPKVVMGFVPYNIDVDNIPGISRHAKSIINRGVVIFVNIGDVDVAASRETVEYTEDTKRNLSIYIKQIVKSYGEHLAYEIQNCNSFKEAGDAFRKYQHLLNDFENHNPGFLDTVQWNGRVVDGMFLPEDYYGKNYEVYMPYQTYNGNNRWDKYTSVGNYQIRKNIIELPQNVQRSWRQKLTLWAEYKGIAINSILVIKWNPLRTEKEIKIFRSRRGLDEYGTTQFKDCTVSEDWLKQRKLSGVTSKSTSHVGKVFLINYDGLQNSVKSRQWNKVDNDDIPDGDKYYVPIDRFLIAMPNHQELNIREVKDIVTQFSKITNFNVEDIYGVKVKHVPKLDSSWKELIPEIRAAVIRSKVISVLKMEQDVKNKIPKSTMKFIEHRNRFPKNSTAKKYLDSIANIFDKFKHIDIFKDKDTDWFFSWRFTNACSDLSRMIRQIGLNKQWSDTKVVIDIEKLRKETNDKYKLVARAGIFPGSRHYKEIDYFSEISSYYDKNGIFDEMIDDVISYVTKVEEGKI